MAAEPRPYTVPRRARLTDPLVRSLPTAPPKMQYVVRDAELPGFYVLVGTSAKTYTVQHDVYQLGRRRTIKRAVGRHGEISCREARAEARRVLGEIATKRVNVGGPGPTLLEAWREYEKLLIKKGRSPTTIRTYRDSVERVLKDWNGTKLVELANHPELVRDRHEEITARHGPVTANHAAQAIRAIYRHARKAYRSLPVEVPTCAVTFNRIARRDTGMALEDLPEWWAQLDRVANPIRRELHIFTLLSGSRPGALIVAEWQHLDVRQRALRIPNPKGGRHRAFNIPLSRQMLASLARARRAGRVMCPESVATYIFPSLAPSGHIEEWKERRTVLYRYGSDLRHTYAAICTQLGVEPLFQKLLLNHAVSDITQGYAANTSLFRELVRVQTRVSKALCGKRQKSR